MLNAVLRRKSRRARISSAPTRHDAGGSAAIAASGYARMCGAISECTISASTSTSTSPAAPRSRT
jgi:hypothetical protein